MLVDTARRCTLLSTALLLACSSEGATSDAGSAGIDAAITDATFGDGTDSVPDANLAPDAALDAAPDECPFANGLTWQGKTRFAYGVNYAWHNFGSDFGGSSAWLQAGVASQPATYAAELAEMRDHGVSVVRWWIFPDFRGDGVGFDQDDHPVGLSAAAIADVTKALELADTADLYLMLCIFSFDAFTPSRYVSDVWTPGIEPMVTTPALRTMLLENVIRPLARAVDDSPYRDRLIAWDVINEPEWAMTGPSPYGDADYDPTDGLQAISHQQMEGFVGDVIAVLRDESDALVTVGAAAFKWSHAWSNVDIDFYQFHMYGWINDYWPYTNSPADYDLDDKPLVMGEFPMGDLTAGVSYSDVVSSWYGNGYAGALSWQYNEADAAALDRIAAFVVGRECETSY